MEKVKTSFVVHCDWIDSMENLPADQFKALIQGMSKFTKTGLTPELKDPTVKALFSFIGKTLKEDRDKYIRKCKVKSEKKSEDWDKHNKEEKVVTKNESCNNNTKVVTTIESCNNCTSVVTDHDNDNEYDNDNVIINKKEKEKEKVPNKPTRFVAPSIEEIKAYCIERKNNVDPENFFDFYQSKGWKIGNNPMKDWKASVRTWERRDNHYGGSSPPRRSAVSEFFAED